MQNFGTTVGPGLSQFCNFLNEPKGVMQIYRVFFFLLLKTVLFPAIKTVEQDINFDDVI